MQERYWDSFDYEFGSQKNTVLFFFKNCVCYITIIFQKEYIDPGISNKKINGKLIVHKTVNEQQKITWLNRIALDDNFIRF